MKFIVFPSLLLLATVAVGAQRRFGQIVDGEQRLKPASCMVKWLTLATRGNTHPKAVLSMEKTLGLLRVDESNSASITADNLFLILGGLQPATAFIHCINRQSPECHRQAPCQNGGRCVYTSASSAGDREAGYSCRCLDSFTGSSCEMPASPCSPSPCLSGATCQVMASDGPSAYQCICPDVYSGRHCETKWLDQRRMSQLQSSVLDLAAKMKTVQNDVRGIRHGQMSQVESFLRSLGDEVREDIRQLNSSVFSRFSQIEELQSAVQNLQSWKKNHTEGTVPTVTGRQPSPSSVPSSPSPLSTCLRGSGGPSGVFTSEIAGSGYTAYCDREAEDGGWTVFQRRQDGSVNFDRNWMDYQHGFGAADSEFWLGLDIIHKLTSQAGVNYELRIDVTFTDTEDTHFEKFARFRVSDSSDKFRLSINGRFRHAIVHDRFGMTNNNGMQFSTNDQDNDASGSRNCSAIFGGPWWHKSCSRVSLNGVYGRPYPHGLTIYHDGPKKVSFSEMKIRRRV